MSKNARKQINQNSAIINYDNSTLHNESLEWTCNIQLTKREMQTLNLLALGLSNNEIADIMGISTNCVESHLKSVFSKTQVRNRVQAASFALAIGLVTPEEMITSIISGGP